MLQINNKINFTEQSPLNARDKVRKEFDSIVVAKRLQNNSTVDK